MALGALAVGRLCISAQSMGEKLGFVRIFKMQASDYESEYMRIDAAIVRARQHSAGARKNGAQAVGRSGRGRPTETHVLVDALGNPVA